ncbi:MAG: holo-ACP synthase [Treponemataceae bacterium]|nr:MAG: holo-ACP synthase [Treponemataceae bacterium]
MIAGIGVDIAAAGRFSAWQKNRRLIERFFHADECAALYAARDDIALRQFLAGRFAAKEAFGKALGTGMRGLNLADICVLNNELGKPEMRLFYGAASRLAQSGARRVHISLSHDGDYAIAFVVLES